MIHLIIAFLLLIFMCLMVVEPSQPIRMVYFFISVLLFAIYNIAHSKGMELSLRMLTKKGNK